jgi:hypothetical protein
MKNGIVKSGIDVPVKCLTRASAMRQSKGVSIKVGEGRTSLLLFLNIKGEENLIADALIQRRHISAISQAQLDLRTVIGMRSKEDKWYHEVHQALSKRKDWTEKEVRKYDDYNLAKDGVLLWRNSTYVPDHKDLRRLVFHEIHDAPYSRHLGYQITY